MYLYFDDYVLLNRLKTQGTEAPEQLVTNCLDLMGPIEVGDGTKKKSPRGGEAMG